MTDQIEFTEAQIRAVWRKVYGADAPAELSVRKVYEACLSELSPETLREELRKV